MQITSVVDIIGLLAVIGVFCLFALAAGFALSWKGSGWFFQTMRTLSGP